MLITDPKEFLELTKGLEITWNDAFSNTQVGTVIDVNPNSTIRIKLKKHRETHWYINKGLYIGPLKDAPAFSHWRFTDESIYEYRSLEKVKAVIGIKRLNNYRKHANELLTKYSEYIIFNNKSGLYELIPD